MSGSGGSTAGKTGKKIPGLFEFRLVGETFIGDCLGSSKFINADHQGSEILKGSNDFQVHQDESQDDERKQGNSDLEVNARDDRGSVLLDIKLFGFVEGGVVLHTPPARATATLSNNATAETPVVPLKMWLVSVGTLMMA